MKKTTLLLLSFAVLLGISSCKKENEPTLGSAPTEADAAFTYAPSADNVNIIEYTATNAGFTYKWDLGNNSQAEGATVRGAYPTKGTYTVTLTVFNSGGSASSSQQVEILEDDASLLNNPKYTLLTGGISGPGSKTWVVDSTRAAHLGVGPVGGTWWEWWDADPLAKANSGLYSDRYTFHLSGFKFDQVTNGSIFVKTGSETQFPGAYQNADDYTAPFDDQLGETWTLSEGEEDTTIKISGNAFIGMYTGVREYEIFSLKENELILRYIDAADATTAWYIRLVPEDYPVDGGGGTKENTSTITLPIDFESGLGDTTQWEAFGENVIEVMDNPYSTGINTSSKVLKVVHGNETWSGIAITLKDKLDFTGTTKTLTLKVYAPVTGEFRMKIEDFGNKDKFIEKDVTVTKANEWEEISIDFSDAEAGVYDKLAIFPGWNVISSETFYIDDISQK